MADFFNVRMGRPGDHALILESWTMTHASSVCGKDQGINYPAEHKDLIRQILARPTTEVRIACCPEDDDAIFGYAVLGSLTHLIPRIYYCFVKTESRNLGIASKLLGDLVTRQCIYCARPPHYIERLLPEKPRNWIYSFYQNFKG